MDNYIMINGKRIELTEEQIKVLTESKEENEVIHRVCRNDYYSKIDAFYEVFECFETNDDIDVKSFEKGNYYPPECKDLSIQDALHDELRSRLRKFTRNHGWKEGVEKNETHKYYIHEHTFAGCIICKEDYYSKRNDIYFISKEVAETAVQEVVEPFKKEHPEFVW